jgi:hypothetical protein
MANVPLILEDAQERSDGGATGRVGQFFEHFHGGGFAAAVERVHDLPLAAA